VGEEVDIDIEKVISLLAGSSVAMLVDLAERMRRCYFLEVCQSLRLAGLGRPELAVGLLEMHRHPVFRKDVELLTGIITTNHDGLLQVASQEVFGEVNLGFPFESGDLTPSVSLLTPPILQVHGSFTWRFAVPMRVTGRGRLGYSSDASWIPPAILKESKHYPFNKLVGLAYELLARRCDVLRIVGCSLTQNDWNILALIFNAQRHHEGVTGAPFRIEIVSSHQGGEAIKKECSYLKNVVPIGYLTEGAFAAYKEGQISGAMRNVFAYWLTEKLSYHRQRKEFGEGALPGTMARIVGEAR
jgi:hypothetical protein